MSSAMLGSRLLKLWGRGVVSCGVEGDDTLKETERRVQRSRLISFPRFQERTLRSLGRSTLSDCCPDVDAANFVCISEA